MAQHISVEKGSDKLSPLNHTHHRSLSGGTSSGPLTTLQKLADDSEAVQRVSELQNMANARYSPVQRRESSHPSNGLPQNLKSGIENLSGISMADVTVQRNSAEPAKVGAHAFAQGTNIHLGPGQDKHLPHEAWHVVQQKQGRVKPTMQMKGVAINDDVGLEREADVMGARAKSWNKEVAPDISQLQTLSSASFSIEMDDITQCVGLKEAFKEFKDDIGRLGLLSKWLDARAGKSDEDRDDLLSNMSMEELKATLAIYGERITSEDAINSRTLEDVIESRENLNASPDRRVEELALSSPHIGKIIAKKKKAGISIIGEIIALDDEAFAKRNWEEFLWLNKHITFTRAQKQHHKLKKLAKIDRVDGFQAESDGKIYMRPSKMGLHIAIHEAIHKYGSEGFEAALGHPLNEGATEYIAMQVSAQIGVEVNPNYYPSEKRLLMQLLKALDISDDVLFEAYFNNDLKEFMNKMVNRIGDKHTVLFRKAGSADKAIKVFNEGQKEKASK